MLVFVNLQGQLNGLLGWLQTFSPTMALTPDIQDLGLAAPRSTSHEGKSATPGGSGLDGGDGWNDREVSKMFASRLTPWCLT